jgi:hypothetical protein
MLSLIGVLALMLFLLALVRTILDHRLKKHILKGQIRDETARQVLQPESRESRALGSLKWALVLIGIGLGIGAGQLAPPHVREDLTLAAIFVFAGAGYLIYYVLARRAAKAG